MSLLEILKLSLGALAANRRRSILTVLSITVGAFAIVSMTALAESGLDTLQHGIEELGGARMLWVFPKMPERGAAKQFAYAQGITMVDRDRIARDLPHVTDLTRFSELGDTEVVAESGAKATTSLVAADAAFLAALHMKIDRGRAFTDEEDRARARLCVVGPKLAEKVGPRPTDALGGLLTVGPIRCQIIGVLADNQRFGMQFGFDWNDLVVVPSETMGDANPSVVAGAMVFVKTDAVASNEIVKRVINARLSDRHPGLDDFSIIDFAHVLEGFQTTFKIMEALVAMLAAIALFVGGVGVMNMMLVAVSERVREIGIRKALGASPRAIAAQFLSEAVLLSTLGGGTGVAFGLATAATASLVIAHFTKAWQASLAPWAAAMAFGVTMVLGVAFGWLPAKRAAALDPVEAIRR